MNSKVTMGVRILFAVFMLVFGVNKFASFLPMPELTGDAASLMGIYFSSGFMKLIGILEILIGLALVANKYVGLALTFAVAIMFNAAIFHVLHDPAGIGGAALGLILSLVLVFAYKDRFKDLLSV